MTQENKNFCFSFSPTTCSEKKFHSYILYVTQILKRRQCRDSGWKETKKKEINSSISFRYCLVVIVIVSSLVVHSRSPISAGGPQLNAFLFRPHEANFKDLHLFIFWSTVEFLESQKESFFTSIQEVI